MKQRKIITVGNTNGITLDKDVLAHLNAKKGDTIDLFLGEDGSVTFKKHENIQIDGVTKDFLKMVNDTIGEYDEALLNLSKR
ncbi:putative addiction module antidote [Alkalihalobacillus xiaoxiensis]|uniref:Addiction module antidote n=1 Tax=Shouchella xiaoxiensis TaxID=766895 RepID=A0ABS2SVC2_9BACI|nr:AbrB family transcriptional regulator [Shouchella xiaoxiensis]MBM7839429.1 putative addiction module antidote [Shouchella xiaoxiensis]